MACRWLHHPRNCCSYNGTMTQGAQVIFPRDSLEGFTPIGGTASPVANCHSTFGKYKVKSCVKQQGQGGRATATAPVKGGKRRTSERWAKRGPRGPRGHGGVWGALAPAYPPASPLHSGPTTYLAPHLLLPNPLSGSLTWI